jgi:predicted nuclease with TOPRIM domain
MDLLKDLVIKTHEELIDIRKDIGEIKEDLAFHIARTNQLENRAEVIEKEFEESRKDIKKLLKQVNMAHGAIALVGLLGTMLALYKAIKP